MSPKMPSSLLLEEVEWLLGGGMNPAEVSAALGKSFSAIEKAAERAGRHDLRTSFSAERLLSRRATT